MKEKDHRYTPLHSVFMEIRVSRHLLKFGSFGLKIESFTILITAC